MRNNDNDRLTMDVSMRPLTTNLPVIAALAIALSALACNDGDRDRSPQHDPLAQVEGEQVVEARELQEAVWQDKDDGAYREEREALKEGATMTRREQEIWFLQRRLSRLKDRYELQDTERRPSAFETRYGQAQRKLEQMDDRYGELEPAPDDRYATELKQARRLVSAVAQLVE